VWSTPDRRNGIVRSPDAPHIWHSSFRDPNDRGLKCRAEDADPTPGAVCLGSFEGAPLTSLLSLLFTMASGCERSPSLTGQPACIERGAPTAPHRASLPSSKRSRSGPGRPFAVEFGDRRRDVTGRSAVARAVETPSETTNVVDAEARSRCAAQCEERTCGADDCGGSCGTREDHFACVAGHCICSPDCDARECGSDGCGGSCGTRSPGEACGDDGQCAWLTRLQRPPRSQRAAALHSSGARDEVVGVTAPESRGCARYGNGPSV
jgi:hypothetical protein